MKKKALTHVQGSDTARKTAEEATTVSTASSCYTPNMQAHLKSEWDRACLTAAGRLHRSQGMSTIKGIRDNFCSDVRLHVSVFTAFSLVPICPMHLYTEDPRQRQLLAMSPVRHGLA